MENVLSKWIIVGYVLMSFIGLVGWGGEEVTHNAPSTRVMGALC